MRAPIAFMRRELRPVSDPYVGLAVAPKPVNVLLIGPDMRVADLADAGVRRVSTGGALAAAAWPRLIEPFDC